MSLSLQPHSPEPNIVLTKAFTTPFKNVVATARTCYSGKGIISDEDIVLSTDPDSRDMQIAHSIYKAGHHTTFQHAHFQFTLSNISRQFIWSFLHSHPFYNSEQVSQRYVKIKKGNFFIPPLKEPALSRYTETVKMQMEAYARLNELLFPVCEAEYFRRFPARIKHPEKWVGTIRKKVQEISRYVVPVASFAYLYHTISGITLLRYWRFCQSHDVPFEQKLIVEKMVEQVLTHDPDYNHILQAPLDEQELPEFQFLESLSSAKSDDNTFIDEFDRSMEGRTSKLVDWKTRAEQVFGQSIREILGLAENQLGNSEAIEIVLNPSNNSIMGEVLNLTAYSKLSRAMYHVHYTFRKKLSHTADSQDQRHRMTPASRPILHRHFSGDPDYITPELVKQDSKAGKFYDRVMSKTWKAINNLRKLGVSDEFACYLLPNAVSIRFTESADLLNLHHKYRMRLCYNAQEEIWRASVDEVEQIRDIHPRIGEYLLPPCAIRFQSRKRPLCPEGDRFCGEPVWKMDVNEYKRII